METNGFPYVNFERACVAWRVARPRCASLEGRLFVAEVVVWWRNVRNISFLITY